MDESFTDAERAALEQLRDHAPLTEQEQRALAFIAFLHLENGEADQAEREYPLMLRPKESP